MILVDDSGHYEDAHLALVVATRILHRCAQGFKAAECLDVAVMLMNQAKVTIHQAKRLRYLCAEQFGLPWNVDGLAEELALPELPPDEEGPPW